MKFEFIEHQKCTPDLLREIVLLKNESWEYPIEEHLDWISRNLHNDDIHLLLRDNGGVLVAYLNIIKLSNLIKDSNSVFYGIGNVCVSQSNRQNRFGFLIIKIVEYYCYQNKSVGILLCKDELNLFYSRCKLIKYTGLIRGNANTVIDCDLFSTEFISSDQIFLERIF